jgi:phosphoglycolate phosphatase
MSDRAYDFWLLDLDGTLVDIERRYIHSVFDRLSDRLGIAFSDREAEAIWYSHDGVIERVLGPHGIERGQFWEAFHRVEDPQARAAATYLYDDAAFVADLDVPVGLVTHCQRYLTDPVLDRFDIADWFDAVVCCTDEIGWKPDPAPLYQAIDRLGVEGSGVLAGDSPSDLAAARNAGLDALYVARSEPFDRRIDSANGAVRIDGFGDLAGHPEDG